MQFDMGKLAGTVNGDEQVKLALRRLYLGNVNMEVADRYCLNFLRALSPSILGNFDMPCRCRQRCRLERVRCGMLVCNVYRQSSSGNSVKRRNATTAA
jgi:hypothetical protein